MKRFSEHFWEREGTLPLSLSEIGRAKLHGSTKTGTTQGAGHSGPDQAQGVCEVGGILFAHGGRGDIKAVL